MTRRHPKPTATQNAGRTLRKAADIIEDRGWIQGMLGNAREGFCAIGAIVYTLHGHAISIPKDANMVRDRFATWLITHTEGAFLGIEPWNDSKDNSKEMVIQTMRKAADDLDPQSW